MRTRPVASLTAPGRARPAGIKKQACIARKCLNMQAREESAEGGGDDAAQARKRPKPAQPPTAAPGSAAAGDGERAQADAVGAAKAPRSHSDENNSESNAAGMDTDEIAPGVAAARKEHKDATWAGNTDVLLDYLVRRKGRTEGWKRLRETDLEEGRALDVGGDWPWADKTALEVRAARRPCPFKFWPISNFGRRVAARRAAGGVHLDERPP